MRAGYPELFWRPADGTGSDERLLTRANDLVDLRANGWSADGRQLLFTEVPPAFGRHRADRDRAPVRREHARQKRLQQRLGGRVSKRTLDRLRLQRVRSTEIYVERYPELGNRQPISPAAGVCPLWSRDGRELFFSSPDGRQMFAVGAAWDDLVAGRPQVLFEFAMRVKRRQSPVRRRPRRTVPHHPQWPGGSRR